MSLVEWFVSWIEVPLRLPCTPPIKTSTSPSFFLLCAETSLSERIRHLSELNRSHPSATRSTRSLLSSVSDPIRSLRYTLNFYTCHGRSIKFLASVSSPFFFFFRPSVLGFVTLFLSSLAAPFTPFGLSLLCKRSIGVTVKTNNNDGPYPWG